MPNPFQSAVSCWRLSLLFAGFWFFAGAQHAKAGTLISKSEQFVVVWEGEVFEPSNLNGVEKNNGLIALTPDLVALNAEQIKDMMLQALGVQDSWRNKIRFTISSNNRSKEPFITVPTRYANGWGFQVVLKPKISEDIWLRNLVHVLLLEMVNRPSPEVMCNPPAWLIEGLRQFVLHSAIMDPSLTVDDMVEVGVPSGKLGKPTPWFYKRESTFQAKQFLQNNDPLSAEQIFSSEEQYVRTINFRHCAHLLFRELSLMPDGKPSMHRFIEMLPRFFNWQTAFHQAYQSSFPNMLSLEKWWAVLTASITQYNDKRRWSMERSLEELGRILNPPAKMAVLENDLPQWQTFAIKDVIAQWSEEEREAQTKHLIQQLQLLKAQSNFEVMPLIESYLDLFQSFDSMMGDVGYAPDRRGQLATRASSVIKKTTHQLEQLETQRVRFLEHYKSLDAAQNASAVN